MIKKILFVCCAILMSMIFIIPIFADSQPYSTDLQPKSTPGFCVKLMLADKIIYFDKIEIGNDFVSVVVKNSEFFNCNEEDVISLSLNDKKLYLARCQNYSNTEVQLVFLYNKNTQSGLPNQNIKALVEGLKGKLYNSLDEEIEILSVSCDSFISYRTYSLSIAYCEANLEKMFHSDNLRLLLNDKTFLLSSIHTDTFSDGVYMESRKYKVPKRLSDNGTLCLTFTDNPGLYQNTRCSMCNLMFSILEKLPGRVQEKFISLTADNYRTNKIGSMRFDTVGLNHAIGQKLINSVCLITDYFNISFVLNKSEICGFNLNTSKATVGGTNLELESLLETDDTIVLNFHVDFSYLL